MKKGATIVGLLIMAFAAQAQYVPNTTQNNYTQPQRFDNTVTIKRGCVYCNTIVDSAGCFVTVKNWNTPRDSSGNSKVCNGAASSETRYLYSSGAWNIVYKRQ